MTRWPRAHVAAAVTLAASVIALATSNRFRPGPRHKAQWVAVGSLRLRYVRSGHGETVVLLHGYGESLLAWRAVFDELARRHDVVALDLPGFGLSSKPDSGYETDSLAQLVGAFMQALDIRTADVVGHSMGGAIAAALAANGPDRVAKLVLLDAAVVGAPAAIPDRELSSSAAGATRSAVAAYEAIRTRFNAPHDPAWLAESDSSLAYVPADDPAYRDALSAVLRQFDFGYLTPDRARRISAPTLVLWGEYDQVFGVEQGRAVASRIPGARFEVIARCWHRPHEEQPGATADAIIRFLGPTP